MLAYLSSKAAPIPRWERERADGRQLPLYYCTRYNLALCTTTLQAITICNMNSMQRSVLQKYGIEDSTLGIEVFDRMLNVGAENNFTAEELELFDEIERKANGSKRLKMEGNPKCSTMFLSLVWKNRVSEAIYRLKQGIKIVRTFSLCEGIRY